MIKKSVILTFPKELVDQPVVNSLVRRTNIEFNILQATITPNEDGHMFAILRGESDAIIDSAINYLTDSGVRVAIPLKNIFWDEDACVHCGACAGQCPSAALAPDAVTRRTVFAADRCIACELCVPACSYGALESTNARLKRIGELS